MKMKRTKVLAATAIACLSLTAMSNADAFVQSEFSATFPAWAGAQNIDYETNQDGDGLFAVYIRSSSLNAKSKYWLYEQGTYKFLSGTLDVGPNQYAEGYYDGYAGQGVYLKGDSHESGKIHSVSGYWRH